MTIMIRWLWCGMSLAMGLCALWVTAAAASSEVKRAQAAYESKQYQEALESLERLPAEAAGSPDILRLKTRTLLKLGRPKDALKEYDQLERRLGRDDTALLRDVAFIFVTSLLHDMREQMRGAAYTALKELDSPDAIPYFEDGLTDGSGLVRALAAEGLAKSERGRRSARFKKALDDEAVLVKEAVLKGMGKSGDASAIPLIEPGLKHPEVRVRVAAAEALCRLGRSDGCDLLTKSGTALNPDERSAAIRAMVDLRRPQVFEVLIEASTHKQPSVRGAAAAGFGTIGKPEAISTLSRLLTDPIPPVRISAAVSLGHARSKEAVPLLRTAMEDRDASVKAFVVAALLELGEPYGAVSSTVLHLSNAQEPAVRAAIARGLGHATAKNDEAAREALMVLVQDTVPRVRIAALKSLKSVGRAQAIPWLKQGLHDEDDAVRATAGGALAHVLRDFPRPSR